MPEREGDFVLFVTIGKKEGDYQFDEGITDEGVLTWQSQPKQGFKTRKIQQLIQHDELVNNIYLFLRGEDRRPYAYLGTLKYLSHDSERENPVHFQWQLLSWPPVAGLFEELGMIPAKMAVQPPPTISPQIIGGLTLTEPPQKKAGERTGSKTNTFKSKKSPDYSARDAKNRKLGLAGEELVLAYEAKRLTEQGREDLAQRIRHISKIEGDRAGYDIHSWEVDGQPRFIEVKTTEGSIDTPFFISSGELSFSEANSSHYWLYRVYDYSEEHGAGMLYIVQGEVSMTYDLRPTNYRATM